MCAVDALPNGLIDFFGSKNSSFDGDFMPDNLLKVANMSFYSLLANDNVQCPHTHTHMRLIT